MENDATVTNKAINMRQVIVMLIAALSLMFSWVGLVCADSTTAAVTNPTSAVTAEISNDSKALSSEAKVRSQFCVRSLSSYKELQKLLVEARNMRKSMVRNHKNIVKAVARAKKTNQNISWASTIYREDLKKQLSQLKTLRATQEQYWQAMKTARQAKDKTKMEEVMQQILSGRKQINALYTSIIATQKQYYHTVKNPPKVL